MTMATRLRKLEQRQMRQHGRKNSWQRKCDEAVANDLEIQELYAKLDAEVERLDLLAGFDYDEFTDKARRWTPRGDEAFRVLWQTPTARELLKSIMSLEGQVWEATRDEILAMA